MCHKSHVIYCYYFFWTGLPCLVNIGVPSAPLYFCNPSPSWPYVPLPLNTKSHREVTQSVVVVCPVYSPEDCHRPLLHCTGLYWTALMFYLRTKGPSHAVAVASYHAVMLWLWQLSYQRWLGVQETTYSYCGFSHFPLMVKAYCKNKLALFWAPTL